MLLNTASAMHRRIVTVNWPMGLHLRTSSMVASLAQRFQSAIRLRSPSTVADAKSVFDLLTLAAETGSQLELEADGADAETAVSEIGHLFEDSHESTAPAR